VRARFVADGEVVLEQWIQFLGRLTIDSCRVELVPVERCYGQEPSACDLSFSGHSSCLLVVGSLLR